MLAQSGCLIALLATIAGFGLVLGEDIPTAKPCCWKGRRMVRDGISKGTVNEFLSLPIPFMSSPHATWVPLCKGTAVALMGCGLDPVHNVNWYQHHKKSHFS